MRHFTSKKTLIAASVAATLCVAPHVFAAEQALEEVIVTARKRDENLQQVPTAINVITADSLQNRQVSNITDLERISPNITMTETGGSQAGSLQVFMRGIGNDNGFDPGVGLYIDDVFIQRTSGAMLDLYDVERIEVLKGPQGNLYGRNTIGGAIKYITKEPDDSVAAQVETKIGSYNLRQVKTSISGPLVDGLLYGGFGSMYKVRDSIQKNDYNGAKLWDADVQGYRGNLKFTPRDDVTVKFGADYTRDKSAPRIPKLVGADVANLNYVYGLAQQQGTIPASGPAPDFSGINTGEDHVNSEVDFNDYRLYTFTGYLSVQWDMSDEWSFKSVTAERKVTQTFLGEFDGSGIRYLSNTQQFRSDDWSQELQANYTGDSIDAVAGMFYTKGRADTPSVGTISPYAIIVERDTDNYRSTAELKSWSLYGNMDYAFADVWHASLGARLTNDKKTFTNLSDVQYYFNGFPISIPGQAESGPLDFGPESKSWSNFSPSAKLAYDFNEDTMGYVSFSTGFKAGGYNPFPNGSPSITFDPEKVKTYALGLKTTLLDGRLRLNTEAFYNDYSDKQLQYLYVNSDTNALTTFYTNAGQVTTQGIETEISWLTPVDGLQFDLNIGYLDASIDKFDRLVTNTESVDVAGHTELGFSPTWTVQPRVTYTMDLADLGDLLFSADASYRSQSYTNSPTDISDELSRKQSQPENTIYNANIVFNTADKRWRFALEGKNLSNKRVLTNTFNLDLGLGGMAGAPNPSSTSTFVMGSYNDPRTWAVSAAYKFF